ncbi:TonB-dependent receptor [Microbulbifer sp. CAU 1566]|uniref:TonB-dependent receptor plug domain-containing protein n=1 Tax=Microbulbifer sp. CAU 1566 TaxID=2933269 RepID=UPI00200305A8|nr:TonB-dependent receptor [Microbulbifer sp. CAU 1566]MCK7597867.1 TonB-dependent receptor [Microbulbifer sp. CAU 1566]
MFEKTMFEKKKLSLCVALVLGVSAAMPLSAQESSEAQETEKTELQETLVSEKVTKKVAKSEDGLVVRSAETMENVVVTGSLIPRSTFDGPDPMTVIGEEDMKARGLNTVADVIDSLAANTGYREGEAGNLLSGFTVGASEANLRGMGAGRTLVLVNGRRIADYPLPFGGEQNGADLGTIPGTSVSRVEILNGSASAIYGSDAVGGVINVITKRDMEQTIVTADVGAYEDGYGLTKNTSFITGKVFDRGSVTFSLEQRSSDAIYADDIEFLNDRKYLTTGVGVTLTDLNAGTQGPVSPMGYDCEAAGLVTTETYGEDGKTVCNFDASGGIAMQPEMERTSTFVDGRYQFSDNISGFATFLGSKQDVSSSAPAANWNGTIISADGSRAVNVARSFVHDLGYTTSGYDQEMWTLMLGLEGETVLGDTTWNWDLGYSKARYNMVQKYGAIREDALRNWILDGAQYSQELSNNVYVVNNSFFDNQLVDNIFRDASGDIDELMGMATTYASSSADSISAKAVGELSDFGFLYNPVTVAVIADWATQSSQISPDERSLNLDGNGWLNLGAIEAGGSRDRTAIGAEFLIPVVEDLELTFATRMDRYDDSTAIGGRNTSSLKFLYSPMDMLKFRGSVAQTFRAPDMFNIYGESTGFTVVADLVGNNCYLDEDTSDCAVYNVVSTRRGSQDLEEEKGKDVGFGFVFTPTNDISLAVDWYNVRLEDLVVTESAAGLMRNEWQCATGVYASGSNFCQDVNNRVIRDASGAVERIIIEPQNHEYTDMEGIDVTLAGQFDSARFGNFGAQFKYVNILSYEWLQFAGDEPVEMRNGLPGQATPANNSNLTLSWSNPLSGFRSVGANLFIQRQGSVRNFASTERMDPYYTANLSANYRPNARMNLGLTIRNLTDEMPNNDMTNRWPHYWSYLQQPYGRSVNLSFSYFLSE